jgi:hypothetical protein
VSPHARSLRQGRGGGQVRGASQAANTRGPDVCSVLCCCLLPRRGLLEAHPELLVRLQQFAHTWPRWEAYLASASPQALEGMLRRISQPDKLMRLQVVVR